eukprot:TRINITY_DN8938_c0_g1_i1.p1 TRINITY_DN8938_c0_g1~~TRINITY_DN8938_c0_g1_i1.p1  ORF type:complete len:997 (+),score=156.38 TRINITY_DN8938_c0_g1_i1:425-2992(+)
MAFNEARGRMQSQATTFQEATVSASKQLGSVMTDSSAIQKRLQFHSSSTESAISQSHALLNDKLSRTTSRIDAAVMNSSNRWQEQEAHAASLLARQDQVESRLKQRLDNEEASTVELISVVDSEVTSTRFRMAADVTSLEHELEDLDQQLTDSIGETSMLLRQVSLATMSRTASTSKELQTANLTVQQIANHAQSTLNRQRDNGSLQMASRQHEISRAIASFQAQRTALDVSLEAMLSSNEVMLATLRAGASRSINLIETAIESAHNAIEVQSDSVLQALLSRSSGRMKQLESTDREAASLLKRAVEAQSITLEAIKLEDQTLSISEQSLRTGLSEMNGTLAQKVADLTNTQSIVQLNLSAAANSITTMLKANFSNLEDQLANTSLAANNASVSAIASSTALLSSIGIVNQSSEASRTSLVQKAQAVLHRASIAESQATISIASVLTDLTLNELKHVNATRNAKRDGLQRAITSLDNDIMHLHANISKASVSLRSSLDKSKHQLQEQFMAMEANLTSELAQLDHLQGRIHKKVRGTIVHARFASDLHVPGLVSQRFRICQRYGDANMTLTLMDQVSLFQSLPDTFALDSNATGLIAIVRMTSAMFTSDSKRSCIRVQACCENCSIPSAFYSLQSYYHSRHRVEHFPSLNHTKPLSLRVKHAKDLHSQLKQRLLAHTSETAQLQQTTASQLEQSRNHDKALSVEKTQRDVDLAMCLFMAAIGALLVSLVTLLLAARRSARIAMAEKTASIQVSRVNFDDMVVSAVARSQVQNEVKHDIPKAVLQSSSPRDKGKRRPSGSSVGEMMGLTTVGGDIRVNPIFEAEDEEIFALDVDEIDETLFEREDDYLAVSPDEELS